MPASATYGCQTETEPQVRHSSYRKATPEGVPARRSRTALYLQKSLFPEHWGAEPEPGKLRIAKHAQGDVGTRGLHMSKLSCSAVAWQSITRLDGWASDFRVVQHSALAVSAGSGLALECSEMHQSVPVLRSHEAQSLYILEPRRVPELESHLVCQGDSHERALSH